jgi:hypothetical protein
MNDPEFSYHEKCRALALHFILDTDVTPADSRFERLVDRLAQMFQDEAENFIRFNITHAGTVDTRPDPIVEMLRRIQR